MRATYGPKAITRDMRRHRITIRELAGRMDITFVRVREARRVGVFGAARALDWYEAIRRVGHDFAAK